ncbi:MAG: hypothetical protein SF051_16835 [Elusimicrobiota bacterium]|nr:hypothetical protein [Elusimicrobiota bacterium]
MTHDTAFRPGLEFDEEARRSLMGFAVSTACLFGALSLCVTLDAAPRQASRGPRHHPAPALEPDAADAVALAQEHSIAGDDLPVVERLAGAFARPRAARSWTAERVGEASYLVVFRQADGAAFAFEVDLESEEVRATPEAVDALTALRVRDERAGAARLVAAN